VHGVFKVSFHKTGDWRVAYDGEFWAESREKQDSLPESRLLDRWGAHAEVFPGGILAFRVFFAHGTLIDDLEQARDLVLIPPPEPGQSVCVFLLLTAPDLLEMPAISANPIGVVGHLSLPDGRRVRLLHTCVDVDFGQSPVSPGGTFIQTNRIQAAEGHLRSFFVGQDTLGHRLIVERSISPETFEKVRNVWPAEAPN
jgi:hypothetical protein